MLKIYKSRLLTCGKFSEEFINIINNITRIEKNYYSENVFNIQIVSQYNGCHFRLIIVQYYNEKKELLRSLFLHYYNMNNYRIINEKFEELFSDTYNFESKNNNLLFIFYNYLHFYFDTYDLFVNNIYELACECNHYITND